MGLVGLAGTVVTMYARGLSRQREYEEEEEEEGGGEERRGRRERIKF